MEKCIVDASVAVKWFFEEDMKEQAAQIYCKIKCGEIQAIIPEIFYAEMASVFRKKSLHEAVRYTDILGLMDQVMEVPFQSHSEYDLSDVALQNALQYNTSLFDSLYLSVAQIHQCSFVTADLRLVRNCKKRFEFIEWLGDL